MNEHPVPDTTDDDIDRSSSSRSHATFNDALASLCLAMLEHEERYREERDL